VDTYALDPNNISQFPSFDISKHVDGLSFSIHNPVLSLFTDFLSTLVVIFLIIFVYVLMRWFLVLWESFSNYEHHFEETGKAKHGLHTINHTKESMPAGVENLPVYEEETPALPPEEKEFDEHPRFAIIKGYMSSNSEALWRIGIMEADNMLQEILRGKGYQGDGVGEMLQNASFKTIDLAWDAHKLRNRIAHTGSDFVLTEREAKRGFTLYEAVFRELGVVK
jgi:hypothetical protein